MKKRKKLYFLFIGISLFIVIIGCGLKVLYNNSKFIELQVVQNLEKKYNVEFEIVSHDLNYSEKNGYNLKVRPKDEGKENFVFDAYRKKNRNFKYDYSDSYAGVLFQDAYEFKIDTIAKNYFSDYKIVVNYISEPFSEKYNSTYDFTNIDFNEINYNPPISIRVSPTLSDISEFDKNSELFIKDISENQIKGSITIMYFNEDDLDSEIIDQTKYQKKYRFYIKDKLDYSKQN